MTTESTHTVAVSRWKRRLAILALLAAVVGIVVWLFSRSAGNGTPIETTLPSSHPIFGSIYETKATDTSEIPDSRGPTGLLPKNPVYLIVDSRLLEWSVADIRPPNRSGYLYFWDPL